jgi:hypothetical protein
MKFIRTMPKLATLVAASALGLAACSDQEQTTASRPSLNEVPVTLEVSSATAARGSRIAVAVKLDVAPGSAGGVQGAVEFDPSALRYVGQEPQGTAVAIVNAKASTNGSLNFAAFNATGVSGRVALFVFEAKSANYMNALRYVHKVAGSAGPNSHKLAAKVMGTIVNGGLSVPTDVTVMTMADWAARLNPTGGVNPGVSAGPGEYRLNLKYGDVDFDGTIAIGDLLAVANAVVGNDQIIQGTDGNPVDVDLVIAGNVAPTNLNGACGTETDGSRVIDLGDLLAVANAVVGNPETCAGNVIPGRGPLPTNVVVITGGTTLSGPDLCTTAGQTINWTKNNIYRLDGVVRVGSVNANCVLSIEAGTQIQGNATILPSSLYIYRGAQISAIGTQNEPIVFTCSAATKTPGCWGGLWISGRARINTGSTLVSGDPETGPSADGGCNQQKAEAGNAPGFGGCNDADNSGRLSYVRIEYGGFVVFNNRELNNLTLSAIGSGTIIDHIQAHGGLDDGIEFFGGRVNMNYVVSTGNNDDGFDTDFGYDGTTQFMIISPDGGNSAGGDDSRAFESDNAGSSSQALPRTNPRIYNATVTGFNVSLTANSIAAIMLRRGSSLRLYNSLIDGYQRAITLRDNFTCSAFGSGDPIIENTTFLDIGSLGSASDDANTPATPCAPGVGTNSAMEASFLTNSTGYRARNTASGVLGIDQVLQQARNNPLPDFRMRRVGTTGTTPQEAGTSTVAAGLVQTNYRGAVGVLVDGQIPWYSGWTRGWQSPTAP